MYTLIHFLHIGVILFIALLFLCVALLLTAQLHNANQLSAWCLHFISSNYTAFSSKPEFSLLTGDNLSYIQAHQWPPVSYLEAMEEYKKKYNVDESNDPLAVGGRGRSSERCSLMWLWQWQSFYEETILCNNWRCLEDWSSLFITLLSHFYLSLMDFRCVCFVCASICDKYTHGIFWYVPVWGRVFLNEHNDTLLKLVI